MFVQKTQGDAKNKKT